MPDTKGINSVLAIILYTPLYNCPSSWKHLSLLSTLFKILFYLYLVA